MKIIIALLSTLVFAMTASSARAGGAAQRLKAKISGTVQTQVLVSPSEGKVAKTKLDSARVFEEFGVSPDAYALVFDTTMGLVLVAKSSLAKLPTIVVLNLGETHTLIDTRKGAIALDTPVENTDAVGNLFQDFVGEVQGVAKFQGTFPASITFTKITLAGVGTGHDTSGGASQALVSLKISASGPFQPTP